MAAVAIGGGTRDCCPIGMRDCCPIGTCGGCPGSSIAVVCGCTFGSKCGTAATVGMKVPASEAKYWSRGMAFDRGAKQPAL